MSLQGEVQGHQEAGCLASRRLDSPEVLLELTALISRETTKAIAK